MNGKTAIAAVRRLQENQQRALSCVSNAVLIIARDNRADADFYSLSAPGDSIPLGSKGGLSLVVRLNAAVNRIESEGHFTALLLEYKIALLDAEGRELLAYHWHRFGSSPVTYPHLHLGPGSETGRMQLLKAHLPTGAILLQDVPRLAIVDFGVRPLRRDWDEILNSTVAELNSGA